MSAEIFLYRPRMDLDYYIDNIGRAKFSDGTFLDYCADNTHRIIDLSESDNWYKYMIYLIGYRKKIKRIINNFKKYSKLSESKNHYIFVYDRVFYKSGWFFKDNLLKKGGTYYAFNKSSIEKMIKKYVSTKDLEVFKIIEELWEVYEPGDILEISF